MLRSGGLVLAANLVDVAAILLRNIILARLLPVDQFGLAATFSILMTMVETFQNVGINRLVVQDARADDPRFVASLHGAQLVVSIAAALLLAGGAYPFALAMGTPALAPAYLLLAVVPLANAFLNLESFRVQRHGQFGPQVLRSFLSQPIGLFAIFPGFWWLGDHRAALFAIIAQQSAAVILTHVHVRQRFRITFNGAVLRTAIAFGWPLVANGLLMFLILHGDRIIVLQRFGPAALGWFSAAVMLTLTPANLIAKSLQTLTLPLLAKANGDPSDFQRIYDGVCSATACTALALVIGTLILGDIVIASLFGAKFMPAATFLAALACMNALRLLRVAPTIAAMACGETRNPLYANLVRGLGVPIAVAAAATTGAIEPMILAGIVAEFAGAITAGVLAHRHARIGGAYYQQLLVLLALCLVAALSITWVSALGWLLLGPLAALMLLRCTAGAQLPRSLSFLRITPPSWRRSHRT